MKNKLFIILLSLFISVQSFSNVEFLCFKDTSRSCCSVQTDFEHKLKSKLIDNKEVIVKVVVPEKTNNNKYPVLFLLHGYGGSHLDWNTKAPLQEYADKYQMIIVTMDAFNSWYVDNPQVKFNYEEFFFNELVPMIKKNYKTDEKNYFLTGLSMGGFGALTYFMDFPNMFRAAGSMSGILDLPKFKGKWGLNKVFIKDDYEVFSPSNRVEELAAINKPIIVDCGTEDFGKDFSIIEANKSFNSKCVEYKVPITFSTRPGKHSWDYWTESLKYHLEFFSKLVNKS